MSSDESKMQARAAIASRLSRSLKGFIHNKNDDKLRTDVAAVVHEILKPMVSNEVADHFPDLRNHITVKQGEDPTRVEVEFSDKLQRFLGMK